MDGITLIQNFSLALLFKILLCMLLFIYLLFTFIIFGHIRSLKKILIIRHATGSAFIELLSFLYVIASLVLFLVSLVIL